MAEGFASKNPQVGGNGFEYMQQRMSAIGGKVYIQSEPGQGTTVRLEVVFQERKSGV